MGIDGIDKEIAATERGEYWRLLTPGTYVITATYTTRYGLLQSDPTTVIISHHLGGGAVVTHLVARVKLQSRLLVSSYQLGAKEEVHLKAEIVLNDIFNDYQIEQKNLLKIDEHIENKTAICHVVFLVIIGLDTNRLAPYFKERWGTKKMMCPVSSMEQEKLGRRLKSF